MADVSISNLPAATSVSSSDLIPVVQSGTTKKANVALLAANTTPATVDGVAVNSLAFSSSVTAADVKALPVPAGTPTVGQVPVVSAVSPLALGWGSGGSGGGSGSSFVGTVIRPETYGAKADGIVMTDLVVTAGSASISSASSPFTSTAVDGGKTLYWRVGGGWGKGVIASVQSSSQATLTANAPYGVQTDGGPNPNSYFGTDNTTALNAAYAAAQASTVSKNDYGKAVTMGREVRLSAGYYITRPLNPMTGWNVRTVGEGMDNTGVICSEPGVIFDLGIYNSETGQTFVNQTLNWSFFDMQVFNPLQYNSQPSSTATSTRIVTGIRDNGSGNVTMERMRFKGLQFGFCAAYGSDFDRLSHIYNSLCDVGLYFGLGSQQVELNNIDGSDCKEVCVFEGCQNWHIGGNSHFQDSKISAITIEGKGSGQRTRSGIRNDINDGGWYAGNMLLDGGAWFETNSGNNGSICPRQIWINGDGPFGPSFSGLVVRDVCFIAGGAQVPGGTNSFIEHNTNGIVDQPLVLDGFQMGGSFINYVYNATGVSNTKPLLKNMSYDTSKTAMVRNTSAHRYILQNGQFHGFTAV